MIEKYDTVGTVPKSNRKIVETGKRDTLHVTHVYMTNHFPMI